VALPEALGPRSGAGSRLDEPERQDEGERCLQTGGDRGGHWAVLVAVYGQLRLNVDNAGCPPLASRTSPPTDRAEDSSARTAGAARTVCSVPRNRPWELEALEHETSSWDSKAGPVRPRRPRQLRDCQDHDGRYRGGHRRDGAAPYWSEPSHQSSVTDFAHGSLTSAPGRGPACSQDSCVRLLRPATRRSRTRE